MKKKVLRTDKLKSMYKKGKVHGEEYWLFKYCQLLFSNVQMLTIIPLVLIHEDVPNASLNLFIFSKQQKKRNPLQNALNNCCHPPYYNFHNLTPLHFSSLDNDKQQRCDGSMQIFENF